MNILTKRGSADIKRVEQDTKVPEPPMLHPARDGKWDAALAAERVASIAVLAFTDMSATKDQDWFCDGIAEEILNALSPLKGLKVAARTSAFSFKGKNDDLRTIGEQLKVTTVLEGSVRRAVDRVRITVQLSDAQDGYQLWSERYDRELKDIFDVQDEMVNCFAKTFKPACDARSSPIKQRAAFQVKDRLLSAIRGAAPGSLVQPRSTPAR